MGDRDGERERQEEREGRGKQRSIGGGDRRGTGGSGRGFEGGGGVGVGEEEVRKAFEPILKQLSHGSVTLESLDAALLDCGVR